MSIFNVDGATDAARRAGHHGDLTRERRRIGDSLHPYFCSNQAPAPACAKHARLDVRPHLSRCLTRGGDPSGGGSDQQIASNRIGLVHRLFHLAEALKHRKRRLVPLLETGYDPALRELF